MTITAYIPCHNNETTIGQAAAALRKQTRPADQYLFINDRCTDRSPDIAREHGFTVVDLVGKKGLAAGRNLALQLCASDVLFGVDADVVDGDTISRSSLCAECRRQYERDGELDIYL